MNEMRRARELFVMWFVCMVMPRRLRYDAANAFYHVMARGNNREPIFIDEQDRRSYLDRLGKLISHFGFQVHAYCLMSNHLHLLLQSTRPTLSRLMERLQGGYARWFNARHSKLGHTFQGRYLSKVVMNNAYLFEVGRYIHMNPVAVGIVRRPEDYSWSSLGAYLREDNAGWLTRDVLLAPFVGADCHSRFYEFTIARKILGSEFQGWPDEKVWYAEIRQPEPNERIDSDGDTGCRPSAQNVIAEVARLFGCGVDDIRRGWRSKRFGDARALAALALRHKTLLTLREVAQEVGLTTAHGVCSALSRLRRRLPCDPGLQSLVKRLTIDISFISV